MAVSARTVVPTERAASTIFVRLDVHKESVTHAVLPAAAPAPMRVDKLPYDLKKHRRYLKQLGPADTLRTCYEALGAGYVVIGKPARRAAADLHARLEALVRLQPRTVRTITADNGTECHGYTAFQARVLLKFYFATPHHSWERGSNENMNGLIRQYFPTGVSMARLF